VKFPASFRFLHRSIRWRTSKSKQKVATIPDRYYIRGRDQVNELKETLLSMSYRPMCSVRIYYIEKKKKKKKKENGLLLLGQ
jgi:hypothetical protein